MTVKMIKSEMRAFFTGVEDALVFAFNHEGGDVPSPVMNRDMAAVPPTPIKGAPVPPERARASPEIKHVPLGGLEDRTIMAAFILSKLHALTLVEQWVLAARYTRPRSSCSCGSKCCQGWFFAKSWGRAIQHLVTYLKDEADLAKTPGKRGYSMDVRLRPILVEDFFRPEPKRRSLAVLSELTGTSTATVAKHRALIFMHLDDIYEGALTAIADVFDHSGITGDVGQQKS